jgi:signal transduction histidine kinase
VNGTAATSFAAAPSTRRLAWPIAAVSVVVVLVALGVEAAGQQDSSVPITIAASIGAIAFAGIGALVASRTGNSIGWLFLLVVALLAIYGAAQTWGDYAAPRGLVLGELALATEWPLITMVAALAWIFLLFPTGTVPSRRWRWVARIYGAAIILLAVGWAVRPASLVVDDVVVGENPLGIRAFNAPLGAALGVIGFTLLGCSVLSVVALVIRFRRADPEMRQQIRWLAYVGILAAFILPIVILVGSASDGNTGNGALQFASNLAWILLLFTLVLGIPVAAGIGILKYRLWDLEVVVRKTLVASVLTLVFAAVGLFLVYVPGHVAFWGAQDWAGILALVVGALIVPTFRLARRIARRVVFGKQAAPYEVLTAFSERVGETYATEDILPRMAEVLAQGTGARRARVWLRVGDTFRPEATWPADADGARPLAAPPGALPNFDGEHGIPVQDGGDLLGALTLTMPASDPMNPRKEQLARDLAAQAGLVLRNVRLIEELRGSRQRLVAAQDERARKLERDIHDGAQQQLVALAVKLRLADDLVGKDDERAHALLADVRSDATAALEDLRDLAHGIYPPLLADKGLVSALESQARRSSVPVEIVHDGLGRFPRDVEAAVYFCVLEALQNAGKYANASRVEVRLEESEGVLRFAVRDDGAGFDASRPSGHGLTNMRDRLEALAGSLAIESAPRRGATISGDVPIRAGT